MADIFVDNAGSNTSPYDTWAKAATTGVAALAIATASDTIYVANTHTETAGASITWTCPTTAGLRILCVTPSGASGNSGLTTGAVVQVGAASQFLLIAFRAYIYGISFISGTNSSTSSYMAFHQATSSGGYLVFENCDFYIPSTNTSTRFFFGVAGGSTDDIELFFRSCSWKFGNTSQGFQAANCRWTMQNCDLDAAGSIPTTLLSAQAGSSLSVGKWEASDLSGRAFTNYFDVSGTCASELRFESIKVSGTPTLKTGTHPGPGGVKIILHNVDSGDTQLGYAYADYFGSVIEETTLVRTGGGDVSFRMDDGGNTQFPHRALRFRGAIRNPSTGSALTLTVPILHDSATALQDDELWVEVLHPGTSGYAQAVLALGDRMVDVLGTAADQATDSGSTWTTTGMSNPNKQSLSVSVTPQELGYVLYDVCLAKGAAKTVYVDTLGATLA